MSFGKAKRFNYKDPDLAISPADYYICTSLEKSCNISKCARFPTKDGESLSNDVTSPKHSTPNLKMRTNNEGFQKIKQRIFNINQQDIQRFSLNKLPRKSMVPTCRVKDLVKKYEHPSQSSTGPRNQSIDQRDEKRSLRASSRILSNIPRGQQNFQNFIFNGLNFWKSEEFLDDDYHSYTSSDDIDLLNKIDYSRIEDSIRKSEDRKKFEKIIMEKMNKIKKRMEEFHENLKELDKKVDSKNIQNQAGSDDNKLKIFATIENLRKYFEERKQFIVDHMIEKLKNLAEHLHTENIDSTEDLKIVCRNTARDLYKSVTQYYEKKDFIDFDDSSDSEDIIEHETTLGHRENECFNYENICQFLSDQLQASQRELKNLEEKNMDLTFKWGSTQQQLETQTSVLETLQEEIEGLKKQYEGREKN